jgi:dienelactone hydrolase
MSCPDCFRGGVSTSHPTGIETTIHGLPTYVAQPDDGVTPKGIIVIITDAFGWNFVNNRVLSDHYAKRGGFLVYCPDFMNGSLPQLLFHFLLYQANHLTGNAMDPSAIELLDKVMESASWFETFVYKPVYVFQTMRIAIPWKISTRISITHPVVISFFQALRKSAPPFPTANLKIGAAGFCWGGNRLPYCVHGPTECTVILQPSLCT